jgi:hypothetical protein
MSSRGDFEEFSIYCENGEWVESGQVNRSSHARHPSLMVLGNAAAILHHIATYTSPFDGGRSGQESSDPTYHSGGLHTILEHVIKATKELFISGRSAR